MKTLLVVIGAGFLFHLMIVFPSGSSYCFKTQCGYFFWGAHGHDSIWHLALAVNAFRTWPFSLPIFSGAALAGYNILLDLSVFFLSLIGIPARISFFKLLPLIWFVLFTTIAIRYGRKLHRSPLFTALLLFFFFFGGSFGYLITLYHDRSLKGSESLLAMQSGHMLLNLQFAFSLVVLLVLLLVLTEKRLTVKKTLIIGCLLFVNFGLKMYGGVISLFLVVISYLIFFSIKEIQKLFLHLLILTGFVALALLIFYQPLAALKNGPLLIFSPFAHVHAIIEEPKMVYLKNLVNARYFLQEKGWGPRLLAIELFSLFLYLFFNFGPRFFGLLDWFVLAVRKKTSRHELILMTTIIFAILLTMLFIQKGIWWNTVQFFYYAIFLANIFASQMVYRLLLKKTILSVAAGVFMILLTLPITFDFIANFTQFPGPAYLPKEEITGLSFLAGQPDGVVLTSAYNPELKGQYEKPYPLFVYADTAYVAAFAKKPLYVADETQLALLKIDYQKRLAAIKVWDCKLIKKVKYIYEVKAIKQPKNFSACRKNFKIIFDNQMVSIYKTLL